MTDSYGYLPIPVVPTATSNPTSFTHANTILEIVDRVRAQLDIFNNTLGVYSDNFNSLVDNVNSAMENVLESCQHLATDSATANAATSADIDRALASLAAAQVTLADSLAAAQTAHDTATAAFAQYQSDVDRQDQSITDQFAAINQQISGYAKINSIRYNVKDFGAVGDGTTDDTSAVLNCISTAATGTAGGIVFFPRGQYLITRAIAVPANATLEGVGSYDAVNGGPSMGLKMNVDPSNYINGASISVGQNGCIRDLSIVGPKSGTGIYCTGACQFDNVNVQLWNQAFILSSLWYGYFRNLRLYRNNAGFLCTYCYNVKFINPRFTFRDWNESSSTGFVLNGNMDIACIGGSIESYDVAFKYGLQAAEHVSLIGVYAEANAPVRNYTSQYGAILVDMTNTSQCSIYVSGCHFYINNTHALIRANGAQRGAITSIGNKVKGGAGTSSMSSLGYYCQSNSTVNVARVMIGDDLTSVSPNPTVYVTPPPDSMPQSLIIVPLGGNSQ